MKYNLFILMLICLSNLNAQSIEEYSARYSYVSDEISINGIRKLEIIDNQYVMNFKAKNLLASMEVESKFEINNKELKTNSYKIKVRPSFVNRDQRIEFNYNKNVITSSGREEWSRDLIHNNKEIFDPLNAQIKIRMNLISGLDKFSIDLLEIESGEIKSNLYEISGKETLIFNDVDYECIVLKRIRETDSRETFYYIAEDLNYMFLKIIDKGEDRNQTLTLLEILSLG
jgi:hypothetical protein